MTTRIRPKYTINYTSLNCRSATSFVITSLCCPGCRMALAPRFATQHYGIQTPGNDACRMTYNPPCIYEPSLLNVLHCAVLCNKSMSCFVGAIYATSTAPQPLVNQIYLNPYIIVNVMYKPPRANFISLSPNMTTYREILRADSLIAQNALFI